MAHLYRRNKRALSRRRRSRFKKAYKKRRTGKASFSMYVKHQRIRNGIRQHTAEVRTEGLESGQNVVKIKAVTSLADRACLEAIVAKTGGHSGTQLGGGTYSSEKLYKKYYIKNYKVIYHLRNLSPQECFVTVYECVARKDQTFSTSCATAAQQCITDLYKGWYQDMGAGTSGTTGGSGDAILSHTAGANTGTLDSKFLSFRRSRQFNDRWGIVKQKKFKLNPGDDIFWTIKVPDRTFNPLSYQVEDSLAVHDMKRGYSKALMIKFHGVMGHSNSTGSSWDDVGLMNSIIAYDQYETAQVIPLSFNLAQHNHEVTHDNLTGITLEGPSEDTMVVEGS